MIPPLFYKFTLINYMISYESSDKCFKNSETLLDFFFETYSFIFKLQFIPSSLVIPLPRYFCENNR